MSSNVVGLAGVLLIVIAIVLLTDYRWGLLALGAFLVVMAYARWTYELAASRRTEGKAK